MTCFEVLITISIYYEVVPSLIYERKMLFHYVLIVYFFSEILMSGLQSSSMIVTTQRPFVRNGRLFSMTVAITDDASVGNMETLRSRNSASRSRTQLIFCHCTSVYTISEQLCFQAVSRSLTTQ